MFSIGDNAAVWAEAGAPTAFRQHQAIKLIAAQASRAQYRDMSDDKNYPHRLSQSKPFCLLAGGERRTNACSVAISGIITTCFCRWEFWASSQETLPGQQTLAWRA